MFAARMAHADATFNVNAVADLIDDNLADRACHTVANTCSLRAAFMQANHLDTVGPITINVPAGTYHLTLPWSGNDMEEGGDLNLYPTLIANQTVYVHGAGAANTIIDAGRLSGVMRVDDHRVATLDGITLRNGESASRIGVGINSGGTVNLTHCVIENNAATAIEGSGIAGGIFNSGTMEVLGSVVRSNTALGAGGGIGNFGALTIRDSAIHDNSGDFGGAIYFNGNGPLRHLYLINSTISRNHADTDGGGIYSAGGPTFLYNVTIADNEAHRALVSGSGGGVYAVPGSRFAVVNSLIARNTLANIVYNDCDAVLEAYGRNLLGQIADCSSNASPLALILPNSFGPLQDNGGPTPTHALLQTSAAIDSTIDTLGCVDETGTTLLTDQRGTPRAIGRRCDVGAFEFVPPLDQIFYDGFQ
jgi:hypothetical protein